MLNRDELNEVSNIKWNREDKFSFFITSLSFATLGAAIHTVSNYRCLIPKLCEISGWVCLFLAGLLGIIGLKATMEWWNNRIESASATTENADSKGNKTRGARIKSERLNKWRDRFLVLGYFILAFGRAYDKVTIWF